MSSRSCGIIMGYFTADRVFHHGDTEKTNSLAKPLTASSLAGPKFPPCLRASVVKIGTCDRIGVRIAKPGRGGMAATILDGTRMAAEIRAEVAADVKAMAASGVRPGLAVVLVGHDPASEVYVRGKVKSSEEVGIYSEKHTPPNSVTTRELLDLVADLNRREEIHGILVQLPLPPQVDAKKVLMAVDPAKDVDGFHPMNVGYLSTQRPGLVPCTPAGVMEILKRSNIPVAGQEAVVVGRSDIVGKPVAMLLLNGNATVTVCHSKTRDLPGVCRRADILVAAIGRAGMITRDYVKPGATVIDVGMNKVSERAEFDRLFAGNKKREETFLAKGSTLVGDVHPEVAEVAGALTPVPGGVGPLTIAMLMANTVKAAKMRRG
jgi:methylenetetrahydrofolate dehydrogenase (NADP+)/methenyltetrahydrofolate cyclohydrolase